MYVQNYTIQGGSSAWLLVEPTWMQTWLLSMLLNLKPFLKNAQGYSSKHQLCRSVTARFYTEGCSIKHLVAWVPQGQVERLPSGNSDVLSLWDVPLRSFLPWSSQVRIALHALESCPSYLDLLGTTMVRTDPLGCKASDVPFVSLVVSPVCFRWY